MKPAQRLAQLLRQGRGGAHQDRRLRRRDDRAHLGRLAVADHGDGALRLGAKHPQRHGQHPRAPVALLGDLRDAPAPSPRPPRRRGRRRPRPRARRCRRGRSPAARAPSGRTRRRLVARPVARARALDLERQQRRDHPRQRRAASAGLAARAEPQLADDRRPPPAGRPTRRPRRPPAACPPRSGRPPRPRARRSSGRSPPRSRRAPGPRRARRRAAPRPTRSPRRAPRACPDRPRRRPSPSKSPGNSGSAAAIRGSQVAPATRREPVADQQALGQAQVLELADVELERRLLAPDRARRGPPPGPPAGSRSGPASPSSTARGATPGRAARAARRSPRRPRRRDRHRPPARRADPGPGTRRNSIRNTGRPSSGAEPAPDLIGASRSPPAPPRLDDVRRRPPRRTEITSTIPTGVRRLRPATTRERSHRRNASVDRPVLDPRPEPLAKQHPTGAGA